MPLHTSSETAIGMEKPNYGSRTQTSEQRTNKAKQGMFSKGEAKKGVKGRLAIDKYIGCESWYYKKCKFI